MDTHEGRARGHTSRTRTRGEMVLLEEEDEDEDEEEEEEEEEEDDDEEEEDDEDEDDEEEEGGGGTCLTSWTKEEPPAPPPPPPPEIRARFRLLSLLSLFSLRGLLAETSLVRCRLLPVAAGGSFDESTLKRCGSFLLSLL